MNIKKLFSIFTLVVIVFTTACTNKIKETNVIDTNEKPREETKIIDSNGAEKAKLNLDFGAGKLNVSGNEEKFMKGKFIYSKRSGNLK
ncbi:lipoprotein [Clostridium botulinum CFSAN001628]|nr:lipoprotein [Clostridium botulinum CFSAN001628]